MSLLAYCVRCRKELYKFGAVLNSPPWNQLNLVLVTEKQHLCVECWDDLQVWIKAYEPPKETEHE